MDIVIRVLARPVLYIHDVGPGELSKLYGQGGRVGVLFFPARFFGSEMLGAMGSGNEDGNVTLDIAEVVGARLIIVDLIEFNLPDLPQDGAHLFFT